MTRAAMPIGRRVLALLVALAAAGCGPYARPSRDPFLPTRFDYEAFRHQYPDLAERIAEPNYLPFMAHRMVLRGQKEDAVVFCRWPDDRFPLAVWVDTPRIHPKLWNEFLRPQDPSIFTDAAWRAVESWNEAFGETRLGRAASWTDADLRIELVGEAGPAPEGIQVLGTTPLARACRVEGHSLVQGRLDVEFRVPVVRIYVADQHGLLPPDQVERNVLHELGHALGMRGHSPIPADLMYEVARDRRVSHLSREDVNSFQALYAIPNGTIYAKVPHGAPLPRPPAHAPAGPLELSQTAYINERFGFSVHVPPGWRLVPSRRGVVAIDGLAWDYEGSFQVLVHDYPTIASYLRRHGKVHVRDGEVIDQQSLTVDGHPAFQLTVAQQGGAMVEDHVFIETGDGRVVVVIEEAPAELRAGFKPWFDAMLASLRVLPTPPPSSRRQAGRGPFFAGP